MVKVVYGCRLGNNLFQYCLGRIFAEELGFCLDADPVPGFPGTRMPVPGARYEEPQEQLTGHRVDFERILSDPTARRLVLDGWFQRQEYYRPYQHRIRQWLFLDRDVQVPALNTNDVVVHVRRTDYFDSGWLLPFAYYAEGIERIRRAGGTVWIVTDDPHDPYLRRFGRWRPTIVRGTPLEHFALLLKAPRLVISHSTFSWWPAFINHEREIVCPVSPAGPWCEETEGTNLILRDWFICVDSRDSYRPSPIERLYCQTRSMALRLRGRQW